MRAFSRRFIFALAAGLGAGWASAATAQDKVIRIGASLSLTGGMATEGRLVRDGYDLYVKLVNERGGIKVGGEPHKVEMVYYDDESNAQRAVSLVERLIVQDKVNFVAGPYSSGISLPASAVAERHRTPMVLAHAASTPVYERGFKYVFGVLTTAEQYTINMIRMGKDRDAKTIALIYENALFPQTGMRGAAQQAKDAGLEVVYNENYPTGTKDLSPMLAAAGAKKPDIILAAGYTADMILLARQAAELGVRPKMMGFMLGPTLPGFVKSLGRDAEYLLEPIQWSSNMPWKDDTFGITAQEYAARFEKEFGYKPDYHPPQSSAALIVYQRAIEKAGTLDPEKVRDAIAQTDLMTFYGPIKFNERGQNVAKRMGVVQIQGGEPKVVYPPEHKQSDLVYPMPPR
jgi:branched-chain amino acid transport system substrate-binding protein